MKDGLIGFSFGSTPGEKDPSYNLGDWKPAYPFPGYWCAANHCNDLFFFRNVKKDIRLAHISSS
jgi:hypothetical protein